MTEWSNALHSDYDKKPYYEPDIIDQSGYETCTLKFIFTQGNLKDKDLGDFS